MTDADLDRWFGAADDDACTRVMTARDAALVYWYRAECLARVQRGPSLLRDHTRAEIDAAERVAAELAIIAEGGLRLLGRA